MPAPFYCQWRGAGDRRLRETSMSELLTQIAQLLRLRGGPQHVPFSQNLLIASIAAYAVLTVAYMQIVAPLDAAIAQTAISVVVAALFVRLVLTLAQKRARSIQTLTAMFGVEAALTLGLVPLFAIAAPTLIEIAANPALKPEQVAEMMPPTVALALFAIFGLVIWSLVVSGHIFRHALETDSWVGLGLSITQWLTIQVFTSLLVTAGGPGGPGGAASGAMG